jgi:hypothetical protein
MKYEDAIADALEQAGSKELGSRPIPQYRYYSYKDGVLIVSEEKPEGLYELIRINQEEISEYDRRARQIRRKAQEIFEDSLRREYNRFSDEQYQALYDFASYCTDWEDIPDRLKELVELIELCSD